MTIQEARHTARDGVVAALKAFSLDPEGYMELMGGCQHAMFLLGGREGLTKDQQVEVLDHAVSDLEKMVENIPGQIESVKASFAAQIETFGDGAVEGLQTALDACREAKSLAVARDFEAHQEQKAALRAEADVLAFNEQIDAVSEGEGIPDKPETDADVKMFLVNLGMGEAIEESLDTEEATDEEQDDDKS